MNMIKPKITLRLESTWATVIGEKHWVILEVNGDNVWFKQISLEEKKLLAKYVPE